MDEISDDNFVDEEGLHAWSDTQPSQRAFFQLEVDVTTEVMEE